MKAYAKGQKVIVNIYPDLYGIKGTITKTYSQHNNVMVQIEQGHKYLINTGYLSVVDQSKW